MPFLSTLSLRRATPVHDVEGQESGISIHALLAESDRRQLRGVVRICISIHALLAESDLFEPLFIAPVGISIHALLAESDQFL